MSDGLPTRARALADHGSVWYSSETVADLLRSLADLCDTYREALAYYANELNWKSAIHEGHWIESVITDLDRGDCARVALATGEQTPDSGVDTPRGDA